MCLVDIRLCFPGFQAQNVNSEDVEPDIRGNQQFLQFGPPVQQFLQQLGQQLGQQFSQNNKLTENPRNEQYIPYGQQPTDQQQFQPLGIFKHIFRPGCGLGGCYSPPTPSQPSTIHIHNHNEAINGKNSAFI